MLAIKRSFGFLNHQYNFCLLSHISFYLRRRSFTSEMLKRCSIARDVMCPVSHCFIHSSSSVLDWDKREPLEKQIVVREDIFESSAERNKASFLEVLETFKEKSTHRQKHVEFIYTALKHLESFGVHKDIDAYKALMAVFPAGRYVPQTKMQAGFFHFPKHQNCAISLLEKMERNGVCPDMEMKQILVDRFGEVGDVFYKFARMLYWFPKFKHLSPFPLPDKMPKDSIELAKLAVKRMMVDLQAFVTVYQAEGLADSLDKTWIVSGQSPTQQELISNQKDLAPFYITGPYFIWLTNSSISYFILSAENTKGNSNKEEVDEDDISNLESTILNPYKVKSLVDITTVHEQEDGIVLGICATGTSSRDSLLSWIRFLQETNPRLKSNPVLFSLKAPSKDLATINQPSVENIENDETH